jgi:plastocyanin
MFKKIICGLCILLVYCFTFIPILNAKPSYTTIRVDQGGMITGSVTLDGTYTSGHSLNIEKDAEHCGYSLPSPRLVVGETGGVKNAIVFLEDITRGKALDRSTIHVLDQKGCEFDPHVMLLPLGAKLEIVNNDAILHNVHTQSITGNYRTVFNIAQPVQGQRTIIRETVFTQPELIKVICDAGHPWMSAYIMVADHPYYTVTDENGYFELSDIPAGTYTLKMWHEGVHITQTIVQRGTVTKYEYEDPYWQTATVTIRPEEKVTKNFKLSIRPAN